MSVSAYAWASVPDEEFSYAITDENFFDFYDAEISSSEIGTDTQLPEIDARLRLSYKLKPEYEDIIDPENSFVSIEVEGSYNFTRIADVNWESGEIILSDVSSAEKVVYLQDIFYANGEPGKAAKFGRMIAETANGAVELPVKLNRLADGIWLFNNGVKGPVWPLTPDNYIPGHTWMAQIQEINVVSARGMLEVDRHENLEYLLREDGTAWITRYTGKKKNLKIPDTLEGHPVTEIGSYAFAYCDGLKTVTLPESIETIGTNAFMSCSNLESVYLPSSVKSIQDQIFYQCTKLTVVVDKGSYTEQYCKDYYLSYKYSEKPAKPDTEKQQDAPRTVISKCITCTVLNYGEKTDVPLHMRYARDTSHGTLTADGALFFMGLNQYVERTAAEIPEFLLCEDFSIETVFDSTLDTGSTSSRIYKQNSQNELIKMDKGTDWRSLPEGRYLIDIYCSCDRGEEYYSGDALLWLTVETR